MKCGESKYKKEKLYFSDQMLQLANKYFQTPVVSILKKSKGKAARGVNR